jgi:hypothetical protein
MCTEQLLCDGEACTDVATVCVEYNEKKRFKCASCALMTLYIGSHFGMDITIVPFAHSIPLERLWNKVVGHA